MTQFDDREKAYESKFARDEELRFKANARRNKLLGLWAAELMGREGAEADAYAAEVIKADFEEAGFKDRVKPGILKRNAMRLLGLGQGAAA